MGLNSLSKRLEALEAKASTPPWHFGIVERIKIYGQISEGTANLEDPAVQRCMANIERYREYFEGLEASE